MPYFSPTPATALNLAVNGDCFILQNGNNASFQSLTAANRLTRLGLVPTIDNWPLLYNDNPGVTLQCQQGITHPLLGVNGACMEIFATSNVALSANGFVGIMCGVPMMDRMPRLEAFCSFWFQSSIAGTYTAFFGGADDTGLRYYPKPFNYQNANVWQQVTFYTPKNPQTVFGNIFRRGGIGVMLSGSGTVRDNTRMSKWSANVTTPYVSQDQVNITDTLGATVRITDALVTYPTTATAFPREDFSDTLQKCRKIMYSTAPYGWASQPRDTFNSTGFNSGLALVSAGAGGYAFGTLDITALSDSYIPFGAIRSIETDNPYAFNGFGRNVTNGVDTIGVPIVRNVTPDSIGKSIEILTVCDLTSSFGDCIMLNVTIDANIDLLT